MDELREMLLSNIEVRPGPLDSECWIWTGPHDYVFDRGGYGKVQWRGERGQAHRWAWKAWRGPIPDGVQCNHHCDVRLCIRPEHLYLGSQQDNIDDRERRGRKIYGLGENAPNHALTDIEAAEIKFLALENRLPQSVIAEMYKVTQSLVSQIKLGRCRPDIEPIPVSKVPAPPCQPFLRRF